jgi:dTDP-D-glucose 4,6-dehydratase
MLESRANFSFCYGDILNTVDVQRCMSHYKIDTIFHLAAMSHVDLSFGNAISFTTTNVLGTHVMLECARYVGVERFIHVSTDEVYGEVEEGGEDLIEPSILAPTNPYAASKAAAEMLVNAYWKSFKLPAIIVRCNNVYGPHQYPESLCPQPIPSPFCLLILT